MLQKMVPARLLSFAVVASADAGQALALHHQRCQWWLAVPAPAWALKLPANWLASVGAFPVVNLW